MLQQQGLFSRHLCKEHISTAKTQSLQQIDGVLPCKKMDQILLPLIIVLKAQTSFKRKDCTSQRRHLLPFLSV